MKELEITEIIQEWINDIYLCVEQYKLSWKTYFTTFEIDYNFKDTFIPVRTFWETIDYKIVKIKNPFIK